MEAKIERSYIVPLRKEWIKAPSYARSKKAVKALRAFIARHMKVDADNVKISMKVNHAIWKNGLKRPPAKIEVKVIKENNIVRVYLPEETEKAKANEKKQAKEKKKQEKEKTEKENKTEQKEQEQKQEKEEKANAKEKK